jgi:hypothetical protein
MSDAVDQAAEGQMAAGASKAELVDVVTAISAADPAWKP